ncbi:hypothetical protein CEXT_223071 [Caerostris extrusa]|uniref:Uncharacterized protein n=1 Tax=Caerostris extrusa TaxID=172846 RepID=A0AAV4RUN9_CAEEX|nr:hypothetical protein CEXT_223071 [Caerostris extrusa]
MQEFNPDCDSSETMVIYLERILQITFSLLDNVDWGIRDQRVQPLEEECNYAHLAFANRIQRGHLRMESGRFSYSVKINTKDIQSAFTYHNTYNLHHHTSLNYSP